MEVVASLSEMGFPVEACKRAAFQTRGQGLESATQWIMEHMDDADFHQPFHPPSTGAASGEPSSFSRLIRLGFTGFYWLLLSFNRFYLVFYWVFTGFY